MPVNYKETIGTETLYQRAQYNKGGLTRSYWDHRDKVVFDSIPGGAKVILDAGCGEGITLEKIVRMYPDSRVSGIDISDENISICRRYGLPALRGDVFNLSMSENSVDCCILSEVIEHLDRPERALSQIRRILKPGGRLIIVFPNDLTFKLARLLTFKFKEAFYDPGHSRQWTPRAMRQCLKNAGFKVMAVRSIPLPVWPLSLHCVVTAVKQI